MSVERSLFPSVLILSAALAGPALAADDGDAEAAPAATKLGAVSVTTTRTEKAVEEVPAAVTLIDAEELQRRQAQDLNDVLRDIPGVTLSGGPRSTVLSPTIRGLGDERVVIRLDDARQNYLVGHKARVFVEPDLLKQVEVLRGPGSTMFGSGAIGGVVSMTTKDAADLLRPGETAGAMTSYGYASNPNENHVTATAFARPDDRVDVLGSVSHRNHGNIEDGAGDKLAYSDDNILSGLLKMTLRPAEGHQVTLSAQRFTDNQQITSSGDAAASTSSYPTDRDTIQNTYTLRYAYADPTNPWLDLRATLYQNDSHIDEYRLSDRRHDERDQTTRGLDLANTSRFAVLGGKHALTYGVERYEDEQEGKRDGVATSGWYPKATMDVLGGFVQDEMTFGALTVTPGVRYDSFDLSADGQRDRDGDSVSPRLAVAYQVTPWLQPFVSYAEAFRAPSLTTMYNSGVHYSIPPFVTNNFVPNPDLKPEKAHNVELGANMVWRDLRGGDKLTSKVVGYENRVDDFIEQTVGTTTTTTSNIPKSRIRGVELELGYDSVNWFGSVGASRIRGKNETDGTPINSMPADQVSFTAGYRFADIGLEAGWHTALVAAQDRVVSGAGTATDGYAVHDLFASWTPVEWTEDVRLNFGVDNIFDKSYRPHGSGLREAGRNVKAGVTLRF